MQTFETFDESFDAYAFIERLQANGFNHVSVPLRIQKEGYGECLVKAHDNGETIYAYFCEEEHEMLVERLDKFGRIIEEYTLV